MSVIHNKTYIQKLHQSLLGLADGLVPIWRPAICGPNGDECLICILVNGFHIIELSYYSIVYQSRFIL